MLGLFLYEMEQYSAAIIALNNAIKNCPEDNNIKVIMYNRLALAYDKNDEPEQSIAMFDKAIKLNPLSAKGYLGKGKQYQAMGDFDKARDCYKKALELDSDLIEVHCQIINPSSV